MAAETSAEYFFVILSFMGRGSILSPHEQAPTQFDIPSSRSLYFPRMSRGANGKILSFVLRLC
jgi:hypothetical protein